MSGEESYCQFWLMPVQFKQVISSFLTQSAYKKLAVSATWHIPPGRSKTIDPYPLMKNFACGMRKLNCQVCREVSNKLIIVLRR
jgi:hypothetical protein